MLIRLVFNHMDQVLEVSGVVKSYSADGTQLLKLIRTNSSNILSIHFNSNTRTLHTSICANELECSDTNEAASQDKLLFGIDQL